MAEYISSYPHEYVRLSVYSVIQVRNTEVRVIKYGKYNVDY